MTIHEAIKRLGLARTTVTSYARRLQLKKVRRVNSTNGFQTYNYTEADLKAIWAEHRRRAHAHSAIKAKNMQRVSLRYRKQAIANRDPEEWRRSLARAVKAAAEKRRRLREWRARHDVQAYDYDLRRANTKKTGGIHPWREAEEASMARWRAKHED